MTTDPWLIQQSENDIDKEISTTNGDKHESKESLGFEDSFCKFSAENNQQTTDHQPLPDSEAYLKGLERKLDRLKKNSKLVDALSEKRDDCLRSLVQNDLSESGCNNDLLLDLEASIINSDSAVHNLFRQIQPVQPVTVGETVHIVNFDQLEEQRLELEAEVTTEEDEELPASR